MVDGLVVVLVLILCAVGLGLLILPIVGTVIAVRASRRLREVRADLDELQLKVARLRSAGLSAPQFEFRVPTAVGVEAPVPEEVELVPPEVGEPAPAESQPPAAAVEPPPSEAAAPSAPCEPPPPAAEPVRAPPTASIEEKIGLVWFTRIGAVIGIAVAGWFFKYMVDNDWVGPWGRVALGAVAGAALLAWGSWMSGKRRTHPIFIQGMLGLGLSVLLVTAYASFGFYHLVPLALAFGVVILLAVLGGVLAWVHRAESILVLSLLAVFLNPVMLSTGVDRPLGLFSYLLITTAAALVVAVRLGFRVATWTAVIGTMALFVGWYGRFFDLSPPPAPGVVDDLPENLQGAYFPLVARWIPLLFAALFPAAWTAAGLALQRLGRVRSALSLYLAAAVAAHAAAAALLYDHPVVLGGTMCALALAFAWLFVRQERTGWLCLPMAVSFLVLATTGSSDFEASRRLPLLVLTGGLTAIYFATFFRSAVRRGALRTGGSLLLLALSGLGFALLAGMWSLPEHAGVYGWLLAGFSVVGLWVALAAGSALFAAGALLASLIGLLTASAEVAEVDVGFLVAACLWLVLYTGAVAVDFFVRGAPWTRGRQAVLAGAGIGFVALFLAATPENAWWLRAGLALGAGVLYGLIGLRMQLAGAAGRRAALLPLGLALVFFTLAIPFLFSGATITIAWALEGAVLAFLASRQAGRGEATEARAWLLAAMVVLAIGAIRLLAVDTDWASAQQMLFEETRGAQGVLQPVAFGHPLAWALLVLGACLLFAARSAGRLAASRLGRWAGLLLVLLGHGALLWLFVGEARLLATTSPPALANLPAEEFDVMLSQWRESLWQVGPRLDMVTTMVLGLYAFVLLGLGFGLRNRLHRLLGLSLFGITVAKLGLYDIWELETIFKIAVGASIATLLLVGAFLYGRFAGRIRSLLVEGGPKTGAVLLVVALGLGAQTARAAEPVRYEQQRAIEGVSEPGDYRVEVDPALYAASATRPELYDIRILGPDGDEVPFLRRAVWHPPQLAARPVQVLDPVILADGGSQALLDLGPDAPRHDRLSVQLSGGDHLRRTRLESSADGRVFGLLAEGGYLFRVSGNGPTALRETLHYPISAARYLRLTVLPGADGQPLRVVSARLPPLEVEPAEPIDARLALALSGPPTRREGETTVELTALPQGIAFHTLVLEVARPEEFVRRVRLEASTKRQAWFDAGGGVVYRVVQPPSVQSRTEAALEIPMAAGDRPFLRLVFEDGDDPPLEVAGVAGLYLREEIVFRARAAGPHRLLVGRRDDRQPRYDLEDVLRRRVTAELRSASFGPLAPNPDAGAAQPDKPAPWTERHKLPLQIAIGLVALVLAGWVVRLVLRNRRTD